MSEPTNGESVEDPADANSPDAEPPSGLAADVFDLASLVNTVKATFKFKEETSIKTIELALNYRLTKEQMNLAGLPPPGAIPFPGPKATEPE